MQSERASVSLGDALGEKGFTTSIVTTYNAYLPYYEEVLLRRLAAAGCTNNIVLMDAGQCATAVSLASTRPRRAGSEYTLIPVRSGGAFHPKIVLRLSPRKGSLFVGSHNLTVAGFGLNDELTNRFEYERNASKVTVGHFAQVAATLRSYLIGAQPELSEALEAALSPATWLRRTHPIDGNVRVLAGAPGEPALWEQIRALIDGHVRRALVVAPFFDSKLAWLRRLSDDVAPEHLTVAIDPCSAEINAKAARAFDGARFVDAARALPPLKGRREGISPYLHAKALWFETDSGEVLVSGSANASWAAMMDPPSQRNVEAVVVRRSRSRELGESTGLVHLLDAPSIDDQSWQALERRLDESAQNQDDATLILGGVAIVRGRSLHVEDHLERDSKAILLDAESSDIGQAVVVEPGPTSVLDAEESVLAEARFLRTGPGESGSLFIIHHAAKIAAGYTSDRRRALRAALGSLEEDPAQLDALLKLSEKVIFDKDLVVKPRKTRQPHARAGGGETHSPESLALDAAGRRGGSRRKSIASGDITVLLDAILRRLGDGLHQGGSGPAGRSEEENIGADDDEPGDDDRKEPDLHDLAASCRRRVGKLLTRLGKQLELADKEGRPARAIVQTATVLGLVRALRLIELREEWRRARERLIDMKKLRSFLRTSVPFMAVGSDALIPAALRETDDEMFEELSLAIGLIVWCGWECGVQMRATGMSIESAEELDERWSWLQCVAYVAPWLALDDASRATASESVLSTPRRNEDPDGWLADHLPFLVGVGEVMLDPDPAEPNDAEPAVGDIVLLPEKFEPRVRLVLGVEPSPRGPKLLVLDEQAENGRRPFMASHAKRVLVSLSTAAQTA